MDAETFTPLPIQVDPSTKAVSSTKTDDEALQAELTALNTLHRAIVGLDTSNSVPPAPMPINPKRSQQIQKLRESGNQSQKKGAHQDAIRMYSLGIEMALGRPQWEPQQLVREEVSQLYLNRAQAHMSMQQWADGLIDADLSLEMKRQQNLKAYWRKGKCLVSLGRPDEAYEAACRGLEYEDEPDLLKLKKEAEDAMDKTNKS